MLFGSNAGYVGSESASALMSWILENPRQGVLLFDEINDLEPSALSLLKGFLDKGEIIMPPNLVAAVVKRYFENKLPLDKWPEAVRLQTNGGKNVDVSVKLHLSPHHLVILGTNAGAEIYTGRKESGLAGRRLNSDQEIRQANARFTGEMIKSSLRARDYQEEMLARITRFIPFKVIMDEDARNLVKSQLQEIEKKVYSLYRIRLSISAELMEFLFKQAFVPLEGAKPINGLLRKWVESPLQKALTENKIQVGDAISLELNAGKEFDPKYIEVVREGEIEPALEYVAGRPLPTKPTDLYERAKKNLLKTLEQKIVGHREELKRIADSVITQLAKNIENPAKANRPIVLYIDSTPGIGKTEIGKAVSEGLFENTESLVSLKMSQVSSEYTFHQYFAEPLIQATKTNPTSMVALLDEFPRAGVNADRLGVQNRLLHVFDEGIVPHINNKQGRKEEATEVRLPNSTIFIATGNLVEGAVRGSERMNNKALQANFRLLKRHPGIFKHVYEQNFIDALRSRLGEPILMNPLTDEEIEILRDRFFHEMTSIVRAKRVNVSLSENAKAFFLDEYIPIRGARWVRWALEHYVESPLVSYVVTHEDELRGKTLQIDFNKETREMVLHGDSKAVKLIKIPREKTDFHPDVVKREARNTSIHEMGHAFVARALFGPGSVKEINTFGGGDGGVTEMGVDTPTYQMYQTAKSGPLNLAIFLGGHVAEVLYVPGGPGDGASSDFERARKIAQTMLLNGSTLNLAPGPAIELPGKDGKIEFSQARLKELEDEQRAFLKFAAHVAKSIIEQNQKLFMKAVDALENTPDQSMSMEEFEKIVNGQIKTLSPKELKSLANVDAPTKKVCEQLLLAKDTTAAASKWKEFLEWFKF